MHFVHRQSGEFTASTDPLVNSLFCRSTVEVIMPSPVVKSGRTHFLSVQRCRKQKSRRGQHKSSRLRAAAAAVCPPNGDACDSVTQCFPFFMNLLPLFELFHFCTTEVVTRTEDSETFPRKEPSFHCIISSGSDVERVECGRSSHYIHSTGNV